MFIESPEILIYLTAGAIGFGWVVGKIAAYIGNRFRAPERDPRDARIRSLEADQRVARTEVDQTHVKLDTQAIALERTQQLIIERDQIITQQHQLVKQLKTDLKDSVIKTRELRTEISQRAADDLRSQVRLRDVELELSVAQASTDMIATGVLDYSVAPDANEAQEATLAVVKTGQ